MTRPLVRLSALSASLVLVLITPAVAQAGAGTADANPWLHRRVLNMAHSGGENEAPMNTMYAFKRAVAHGADMIELDVESTADNQLVVIHNSSVDETTGGTGLVSDMTLRQVQALDAAYNFVPGQSAVSGLPPSSYPLRGVRTHEKRPPFGYRASDFAIPTLREVLRTFRHVPINIEIKGTSDTDLESFQHNATLLAALLKATGRTDVIVVSANDAALTTFHALAPRISLAPGLQGLTNYYFAGVRPIDGTVALQIPVQYSGIMLATPEFVARAHADGYAVHVWFSGTAPDDAATYNSIIDTCADGLMPAYPTLLEHIFNERHIPRPGTPGVDPCGSS
jgi:glycerophosphoryl diester phosphodiesterase